MLLIAKIKRPTAETYIKEAAMCARELIHDALVFAAVTVIETPAHFAI